MARCKDCIHDKVCDEWAVTSGIPFVNSETCEHFTPTADVVPKSESEFDSIPVEVAQVLKDKAVEKAKADVAMEIFEEIEFEIHNLDFEKEETRAIAIEGIIANLKREYTEYK